MFLQCACIVDRWVHAEYMAHFQVQLECTQKRALHSRCTWKWAMYTPVHNASTLQEHLLATIQLLLAITLQAHAEVTFQMWRMCILWEHWKQMLRLHLKYEWNVSGRNIEGTFCQSLKCSQYVNTHFQRPSPLVPVSLVISQSLCSSFPVSLSLPASLVVSQPSPGWLGLFNRSHALAQLEPTPLSPLLSLAFGGLGVHS